MFKFDSETVRFIVYILKLALLKECFYYCHLIFNLIRVEINSFVTSNNYLIAKQSFSQLLCLECQTFF